MRDKLSPIEAEVKFSALLAPGQTEEYTESSRDEITLKKNCGDDGVCVPNLKLDVVP